MIIKFKLFESFNEKTININGLERPTINSLGYSIAQTVKSIFNFYNWFGNSKVVDKQGRPLVVFHGTTSKFDKFYDGSFFTEDYMNADGYASGENVMEVFIKIEKPLIIDAKNRMWNDLDSQYGRSTGEIARNLDTENYDGVIFNNIKDSWIDDENYQDSGTVYFTVTSSQIKSSTGNNGKFKPTDDRIYT